MTFYCNKSKKRALWCLFITFVAGALSEFGYAFLTKTHVWTTLTGVAILVAVFLLCGCECFHACVDTFGDWLEEPSNEVLHARAVISLGIMVISIVFGIFCGIAVYALTHEWKVGLAMGMLAATGSYTLLRIFN